MTTGKPMGKATWWGTWRLPTDRKDQVKSRRAQRAREKRSWKKEERD